jgi:ATP phosphoribosyltransferase
MKPISIVVPDGSMQETVSGLFAKAGLPITVAKKRVKEGKVDVGWIERVAFQRPQEIPHYLNRGHFDVAIVGEDWIANWGYNFSVLLKLPIGRGGNKPVRIVIAAKQGGPKTVDELPQGCEVATEYVQLTERFFAGKDRKDIVVVPSYGNTEHKIGFGATAIVDVTESGSSLRENQLEIIGEIMESNTVVVANPQSLADKDKRPYIDCFIKLIKGAHQASQYVMLIANVPEKALEEASSIMGGLKGASRSTIRSGWFALQSIVPKTDEHDVIFKLLQIGVTDIIVIREIPLIIS